MNRFHLALAACLPAVCLGTPAQAHAFLDGAMPRVGSEIASSPDAIDLHFTQAIEPDFSRIEVKDAFGASVTDGASFAPANDPTHFVIRLKPLAGGSYTVIWHVTAADTHKTQGRFHFTVTK